MTDGWSTRCWRQFLWWTGTRHSSASAVASRHCSATTCLWFWIGLDGSCRTPSFISSPTAGASPTRRFARTVCAVRHPNLTWGIPLYSDCPEIHDYVVQAHSAWGETLAGLYNLAKHDANIEIRVVVQRPNLERLGELAYFIFRNLTFAAHVAFMGLEPIGFARANYEKIWIDPADCMDALSEAVFFLANRGMSVSLYNFPLCTVPVKLKPFSRQSISDWKNTFLPDCVGCTLRGECCGFFRSMDGKWMSRAIKPVTGIVERNGLD